MTVITIDRPRSRNAIALSTMAELGEALDEAAAVKPRVVVLTGGGSQAFISGGDLKELEAIRSEEAAQHMAATMRRTLDRLASLPIPVVAALNGHAFGGGAEVAIACDIRIAAADIVVGFTQVHLGIMPAWGGVERLTALVGRGRAFYLMASGRVLTASEALSWGVIEEVVARATFEERWHEFADRLAQVPPRTAAGIKSLTGAVAPGQYPQLADEATHAFAQSWVAQEHWEAAKQMEKERRRRKTQRGFKDQPHGDQPLTMEQARTTLGPMSPEEVELTDE